MTPASFTGAACHAILGNRRRALAGQARDNQGQVVPFFLLADAGVGAAFLRVSKR